MSFVSCIVMMSACVSWMSFFSSSSLLLIPFMLACSTTRFLQLAFGSEDVLCDVCDVCLLCVFVGVCGCGGDDGSFGEGGCCSGGVGWCMRCTGQAQVSVYSSFVIPAHLRCTQFLVGVHLTEGSLRV